MNVGQHHALPAQAVSGMRRLPIGAQDVILPHIRKGQYFYEPSS
jgi:hypothetical protein